MITELRSTSPASLRAVFRFGQRRRVRIELDINLTGVNDGSEHHWAEITRIIDSSRYHHGLEPDCRECDWSQVLTLIRRCHDQACLAGCYLTTDVRIEDGEGMTFEHENSIELAEKAAAYATAM